MIKIAVVGAGWVVCARHIPALKKSGRCEVIGIIDRNGDRARAAAERFRLPHFGAALTEPWLAEAEAVTVGVAPMSHFEVASTLLDQGKHVLMEKPMCMTVAEGEALAVKAAAKSRRLAIVHNFQFARSVRRAKARLASGRWGKITGLHAFQLSSPQRRLPVWYENLPCGLFFDESPHLLYLLKAFGGPVQLRRASILPSTQGKVTPALVQAEFDLSGIAATLYMNFEAPVSEWHLLVYTEAGVAVIDIFRDILVFVPNDQQHAAKNITRSSFAMLWGHAMGFVRSGLNMVAGRLLYGNDEVVKRFLDAVEGKAELRDIDAGSALDILKLQYAILASGTAEGSTR
jgi:predicted dehydrogenase